MYNKNEIHERSMALWGDLLAIGLMGDAEHNKGVVALIESRMKLAVLNALTGPPDIREEPGYQEWRFGDGVRMKVTYDKDRATLQVFNPIRQRWVTCTMFEELSSDAAGVPCVTLTDGPIQFKGPIEPPAAEAPAPFESGQIVVCRQDSGDQIVQLMARYADGAGWLVATASAMRLQAATAEELKWWVMQMEARAR